MRHKAAKSCAALYFYFTSFSFMGMDPALLGVCARRDLCRR
jgi:hypothetical protein